VPNYRYWSSNTTLTFTGKKFEQFNKLGVRAPLLTMAGMINTHRILNEWVCPCVYFFAKTGGN